MFELEWVAEGLRWVLAVLATSARATQNLHGGHDMAQLNKASCQDCGYTTQVMIGGLMASYRTHSAWPVYCETCDDITTTNLRSQSLACEKCKSLAVTKYDDKHLVKGGTRNIISDWDDHITNGNYFCPKCKIYALRFKGAPDILFD